MSRSRNRLYTRLCLDLNEVIYLHWRNTLPSQRILKNDYELPITNFLRQIPINNRTHNMGWFSSSSDSSKASDGGRIAPDRSSRERCWEGRDRFFACLDQNNILDAVKDDKEARGKCGKEVEEFEGACAKAWVCCAWRATVPCLRLFC